MEQTRSANMSKYDIDVRTIVSDIVRNIWLIIVAAIIGSMIMYVTAKTTNEVTYSSSVTFVVSTSGSSDTTYSNLSTANMLADVFSTVFTSDALKKLVAEDMELEEFPGAIEASIITDTNLLVVRVVSDTPEKAYKAVSSIIEQYPNLSDYMLSNAVLDIIEKPTVPESASNSVSVSEYVKNGVFAGAGIMVAIIVFISFITDTVKSEKSIENKIEAKLIATIYHESKNKTLLSKIKKTTKSILISNPLVGFYFKEAFYKIAVKLEYLQKSKGYKTFLVTSVEENEGKSTVASNIALALADNGNKVLLIDADLRKPALFKVFDYHNKKDDATKDFALFLQGNASFKETLKFDEDKNLYMLYNKKEYSDSSELIASDGMHKLIDICKEKVDFIIVDSPPVSMVSDTESLNQMVDGSMIVVRQNIALTVNINDVIESLSEGDAKVIGCIFNDVKTFFKSPISYGGYNYYKYYNKYKNYYK